MNEHRYVSKQVDRLTGSIVKFVHHFLRHHIAQKSDEVWKYLTKLPVNFMVVKKKKKEMIIFAPINISGI